ncbi:MAG: cytochrome c3 family protein [bacterium]
MHYSQDGAQPSDRGAGGPYEYLLTNDCLGCHSASDGATWYDPLAPVARPDLTGWTGPSPLVNEGGTEQKDMVMCLSCHRAHGSPYPDMLRWDYDALVAGKGCYTCHTAKVSGGS